MKHLGVLVPQYCHVCIHFYVLSRQSVDHAFQSFDLLLLLFLCSQYDVHLELHSIEVVHELGQALARELVRLANCCLWLGCGRLGLALTATWASWNHVYLLEGRNGGVLLATRDLALRHALDLSTLPRAGALAILRAFVRSSHGHPAGLRVDRDLLRARVYR